MILAEYSLIQEKRRGSIYTPPLIDRLICWFFAIGKPDRPSDPAAKRLTGWMTLLAIETYIPSTSKRVFSAS